MQNLVISCIKKSLELNFGQFLGEFCSIFELIYGFEKVFEGFREIQINCNIFIKFYLNFFLQLRDSHSDLHVVLELFPIFFFNFSHVDIRHQRLQQFVCQQPREKICLTLEEGKIVANFVYEEDHVVQNVLNDGLSIIALKPRAVDEIQIKETKESFWQLLVLNESLLDELSAKEESVEWVKTFFKLKLRSETSDQAKAHFILIY